MPRVLGLTEVLEKARKDALFSAIVDVVPTFRSLTVHFDPLRCDGQRLGEALLHLAQTSGAKQAEGRQWCLPVCFDDEFRSRSR